MRPSAFLSQQAGAGNQNERQTPGPSRTRLLPASPASRDGGSSRRHIRQRLWAGRGPRGGRGPLRREGGAAWCVLSAVAPAEENPPGTLGRAGAGTFVARGTSAGGRSCARVTTVALGISHAQVSQPSSTIQTRPTWASWRTMSAARSAHRALVWGWAVHCWARSGRRRWSGWSRLWHGRGRAVLRRRAEPRLFGAGGHVAGGGAAGDGRRAVAVAGEPHCPGQSEDVLGGGFVVAPSSGRAVRSSVGGVGYVGPLCAARLPLGHRVSSRRGVVPPPGEMRLPTRCPTRRPDPCSPNDSRTRRTRTLAARLDQRGREFSSEPAGRRLGRTPGTQRCADLRQARRGAG